MDASDSSTSTRSAALPDAASDPGAATGKRASRLSSTGADAASTYRVKEIFRTVQGEGFWAGRAAVFVRLVGCNMWSGYEADRERDANRTSADCPRWCDTDFTKEGAATLSANDLVATMREIGGPIDFCVVTGGEPFLQLDAELVAAMQASGYEVACETNGTLSLAETFWDAGAMRVVAPDWVVCSPKLPEDQLLLERFDELKLVVPDYHPDDYARFAERGAIHDLGTGQRPLLWLQPEDGPRVDSATELAVDLALERPDWRVSVQTHKVLGVE